MPHMSMGTQELSRATSVVEDSLTDKIEKDAWILQLSVANKTAGTVTFLLKDRQSTAREIVPTVSIPANTVIIIAWPEGVYCPNGFAWQAGAADSLEASVAGFTAFKIR